MAKERDMMDNGWMDWQVTSGVDVVAGEFVVVSSDGADHPRYDSVTSLLERIRNALLLDVIFVAQFFNGRPLVRYADEFEGEEGRPCDPLEEAYGRLLLESRPSISRTAPTALGVLTLPVVGRESCFYGTVFCRVDLDPARFGGRSQEEALKSVARLVASALDDAQPSGMGELPCMPGAPAANGARLALA